MRGEIPAASYPAADVYGLPAQPAPHALGGHAGRVHVATLQIQDADGGAEGVRQGVDLQQNMTAHALVKLPVRFQLQRTVPGGADIGGGPSIVKLRYPSIALKPASANKGNLYP